MSLSGPVSIKSSSREVRWLITAFAKCTGEPVHVVLSAADLVGWGEAWLRELSVVPEDHRTIRFRRRHRDRAEGDQLDLFGARR
jgi:hypothetical protein